jgi:hypothetical protein
VMKPCILTPATVLVLAGISYNFVIELLDVLLLFLII